MADSKTIVSDIKSDIGEDAVTGGALLGTAMVMGRKLLFTTFGLGSLGSLAYFARRSKFVQVRAMRYKLGKWKHVRQRNLSRGRSKKSLEVKVERDVELGVLQHQFCESKPSICFVTGPEGCGSSWLTAAALASVDNVLLIDLHKEQVSGGSAAATELLNHIVRRSGYYYPTSVLTDLGLLLSGNAGPTNPDKKGANRKEVDLALYYLECALQYLRDQNTNQYPCIFIDELHSLRESALKSNDFTRLLQFAMHVTDLGIANVVFVGRDTSLHFLDQEYQSLRQRRVHFPIDYPKVNPEQVKVALRHADTGKIFDGSEESKLLCRTFGGQLRDMEKAIDFANNGLSIKSSVSRMVTETAHYIQSSSLDPILLAISQAPDVATLREAYKKYLRCWDMLCLFSESDKVKVLQDRLLYEIFEQYGHEIEGYVEAGILRYCWPPLGSAKAHEITLTPLSPRFHAAFSQLVNKPGLNKVALDIKRELAKLDLTRDQTMLSQRVTTMLSISEVLKEDVELKDEMGRVWAKLKENWNDYDCLKDGG